MDRLMNNVNIVRQKCPCEKRKATISSLTLFANRQLQLGGRKRRAVTPVVLLYQEGTTVVREQQEVGSQRPRDLCRQWAKGKTTWRQ